MTPLIIGCLLAVDRAGDRLHKDTLPGAIAEAQRKAVGRALRRQPGASVGELSAAACLPASVVVRRLAELGEGWR